MALFVLLLCPFDISVGIGAFVIGLGQISSFLSSNILCREWFLEHRNKGNIGKKDCGNSNTQSRARKQIFQQSFCTPKKDGGSRPIFNLKKLKGAVKYEHFKMEGFYMVKNVMRQGDFLCKIDLKEAYLCIPIHSSPGST